MLIAPLITPIWNNTQKVQKHFPFFFLSFVFWHNQYVAPPKVLPCSLFGDKSPTSEHIHTNTSPTGILAPAGETRLSYQQCTEFLTQLRCQSFMLARAQRGRGCRVNHGVMKQNYSGLCEIQICRLISLFTLVFVVWKAMAYHFGNSRQGLMHSFSSLFLSFVLSLVLVPSVIATLMPWLK